MLIYLKNQQKNFPVLLETFKRVSVMPYDRTRLVEKVSEIVLTVDRNIEDLNLQTLFSYKVFPENILIAFGQWEAEGRSMRTGDTIVQQVFLPPVKSFSQKMIFGVRIKEIINTSSRKGFSYETLAGHGEKGISTFTIEQTNKGLVFRIHTFSAPGNWFIRLVGPVLAIPYQTYCTQAALKNCKREIEMSL
ncbi:DUF1990 family protein [Cytophagaceae bacterium DM2B3-1]|uniref:DUF1990 family protein n=1 Tax=Xanthocytophaga flava TaxID=3048013 RepID=A0ABT7CKD5_9BACT|nr:DUF1990 family protein [Xanthocytophaga flavus]MDJ1469501.1 DUF1990 family protein [Xanthocytophaga flavus]MDJ1493986.1 DUF1990 family protein [Xanthocytophaga flavus]